MSHALATVLHRGRKAVSNVMAACLASSRGQGIYSNISCLYQKICGSRR